MAMFQPVCRQAYFGRPVRKKLRQDKLGLTIANSTCGSQRVAALPCHSASEPPSETDSSGKPSMAS